jgi:hypothetical protein
MGDSGLEKTPESPGNTPDLKTGNAESDARLPELPPDLAKIAAAWPSLPKPIRRAMLALIG